jgi:hypothetical protein
MTWLRIIVLIALTIGISGCNLYFSKLQIVNGTDTGVVGLSFSDGQKTWKLRDLGPGERVTFTGHQSREGGGTVSWIWRGKAYSGEGCYNTEGSPAVGTLTIVGEKLQVDCDS